MLLSCVIIEKLFKILYIMLFLEILSKNLDNFFSKIMPNVFIHLLIPLYAYSPEIIQKIRKIIRDVSLRQF